MGTIKTISERLLKLYLIELTCLSLALSRLINTESAITLLIFTMLFGLLTFQLHGTTTKKLTIITAGNIIGLFWNLIFHNFAVAGANTFGEPFNAFYTIAYPLLNLMWVVPFWSLSIGILPRTHKTSSGKMPP